MQSVNRRQFLAIMTGMTAAAAMPYSTAQADDLGLNFGKSSSFSWLEFIERARKLAQQPYQTVVQSNPDILNKIDWAAHGNIHFKAEDDLFADGPGQFPIAFFHPGRFFQFPVTMYRLQQLPTDAQPATLAREIRFDKRYFDMPADSPAQQLPSQSTQFAGFRIQESRLLQPGHPDWHTNDWVAFLGASYFRAIGDDYQYGLSARGIAINVVETDQAEEFPGFTHFYFAPAAPESNTIVVYALLDGPSVTGAYRFDMTRNKGVIMDVNAHVFLRRDVARLGIAPITSMYLFAEKDKHFQEDWRPEVHDSDGLALWTGNDEHIWRPLINPNKINVSAFADHQPHGFGLMQRQRRFDAYLDGVHYERRPGLWVTPLDDWGEGDLQLVELNTDEEIYDNIVAMWVPRAKAVAGNTYHLRYRLAWQATEPFDTGLGRCVATRIGRGGEPAHRPVGTHKFEVEFQGDALHRLPANHRPEMVISTTQGIVSDLSVDTVPDEVPGHWRVLFDLSALSPDSAPAEIRLFLRDGATTLTETWLYQFHPA